MVALIQSDELLNGEAVVVANGKAYVRSDGVCSTCVAVVDVSDFTSNNGLVRLSMLARAKSLVSRRTCPNGAGRRLS